MRVAVSQFGSEVSPRFGRIVRLTIVELDGGRVCDRQAVFAPTGVDKHLVDLLESLGVEVLVCGGIEHALQRDFERRGIHVIWGVIGSVELAVEALANGTLRNDQFVGRATSDRIVGDGSDGPAPMAPFLSRREAISE